MPDARCTRALIWVRVSVCWGRLFNKATQFLGSTARTTAQACLLRDHVRCNCGPAVRADIVVVTRRFMTFRLRRPLAMHSDVRRGAASSLPYSGATWCKSDASRPVATVSKSNARPSDSLRRPSGTQLPLESDRPSKCVRSAHSSRGSVEAVLVRRSGGEQPQPHRAGRRTLVSSHAPPGCWVLLHMPVRWEWPRTSGKIGAAYRYR